MPSSRSSRSCSSRSSSSSSSEQNHTLQTSSKTTQKSNHKQPVSKIPEHLPSLWRYEQLDQLYDADADEASSTASSAYDPLPWKALVNNEGMASSLRRSSVESLLSSRVSLSETYYGSLDEAVQPSSLRRQKTSRSQARDCWAGLLACLGWKGAEDSN